MQDILFVRSILWDLGISQSAIMLLYEDNDACTAITAMANAQKSTSRTRHMDIKNFALSEWVEQDLLKLERVHTSLNMSDHFTKQLGPTLFHRHINYILAHVPPTYLSWYQKLSGQQSDKTQILPTMTVTPIVSSLVMLWTDT